LFFLTVIRVVATLPVNDERQSVSDDVDDDFFDDQSDDLLACLNGCAGTVPRFDQIFAELH
jgi:hypothetical protein